MTRDLERLTSTEFDVLVVGGGIYGLAVAYDAAERGLEVALIERGDFGGATSFNSLKTLHGGLRALQTLDVKAAAESIRERRTFARIAPHLVEDMAFVLPTTWHPARSRLAFRVAFLIESIVHRFATDKPLATLELEGGRIVPKSQCYPFTSAPGVTGCAVWHDYQVPLAERMTLAFAQAAASRGALAANHVEAVSPLRDRGRVSGMKARDHLTGNELDIRARLTVNAAGAAAGTIMSAFGLPRRFPLQKAVNVVVNEPPGPWAIARRSPRGGLLLRIPWRGRSLVGTWHFERPHLPDAVDVAPQELDEVCTEATQLFGQDLRVEEVTLVHRGLVPGMQRRDGRVTQKREAEILDHAREGIEGAISVVGVKFTTARLIAERTVNLIVEKLGRPAVAARTARTPLPGGEIAGNDVDDVIRAAVRAHGAAFPEPVLSRLVRTYGSQWEDVARLASSCRAWAERLPGDDAIAAQVVYAIRHEMACTLTDVVVRRTSVGSAGAPHVQAVARCLDLLSHELRWEEARARREVEALERFYEPVRVDLKGALAASS